MIGVFLQLIYSAPTHGQEEYFYKYIPILNLFCLLFTAFFTAVWIFFIVHAAQNPNLELTGMRTTWIVAIIILGAWVMPFYWFHHIWRDAVELPRSGVLGLN
jgi:hypothetical protein